MHCLIVDDSAQFRAAASGMLERAGITVDLACNGAEALQCYRTRPPDVTLVDVDLDPRAGSTSPSSCITASRQVSPSS